MQEKQNKYLKIKIISGFIIIISFLVVSYVYIPKVFNKKTNTENVYKFSRPDARPDQIKGERITLKRLEPRYYQEYYKNINYPKVLKPLYFPEKLTFNWLKIYLDEEIYEREIQKKTFLYIIFENKNNKLIGSIEIREYDPQDNGQFGVWITPRYWGKGYVQEAFKLISKEYFKLTNEKKFNAHVEMWNLRSYYALKKCGFKLVDTLDFKNKPNRYLLEYYNPEYTDKKSDK